MPKKKDELPPDHLTLLNRVIASCNETAELCDKCRACHINVDKEANRNREQLEIATRLKRTFFPNAS